jgi:hypothetical protein
MYTYVACQKKRSYWQPFCKLFLEESMCRCLRGACATGKAAQPSELSSLHIHVYSLTQNTWTSIFSYHCSVYLPPPPLKNPILRLTMLHFYYYPAFSRSNSLLLDLCVYLKKEQLYLLDFTYYYIVFY